MKLDIVSILEQKAQVKQTRIIFPESEEANVLQAAQKAADRGICRPVFVGDESNIKNIAQKYNIALSNYDILSLSDTDKANEYIEKFAEQSQLFSVKKLHRLMKEPLYFAAMAVHFGDADAMVSGYQYSTAEVILASQCIIGLKDDISLASSIFLMNIPDFDGPEGNLIVLADGGVCEMPDAQQLADIAISSADTAKALLGWEPRIAMLSYSTMGSANSESTKKVATAVQIVKQKRPDLKIDGEMQLDAAIVPSVAQKKIKHTSDVAGKANILIVPDLNSGNILYKGIQRFANADAFGPFLQGFKKTVSDLSRGSSVDDIYGVIALASIQANSKKQ